MTHVAPSRHLDDLTRWSLCVLCALCLVVWATGLRAAEGLITWDALAPGQSAEQLAPPPADAAPIRHEAATRFDPLALAQTDMVALETAGLAEGLLGRDVVIDGYVLPLEWDGAQVVEFLLVPWVGACIHTPAPPPNQIIHVSYPDGLTLTKAYEPMRLSGVLAHHPARHQLFLVDGTRSVPASYGLSRPTLAGPPGEVIAASASDVPALIRAQIWINSLFVDAMSAMDQGSSLGAFAFALLLSFGYGALHTIGPGHGKSVIISYFVGTGGSLGRGITMGLHIAVIHVLSAIVLVWLLDVAVRQTTGAAPSDYRAIRLGSYGLIVVIGAVLLWQAIRAIRAHRTHAHAHSHHHDHHGAHHHGCAACAAAESKTTSGWIAASVGIVPCTGALLIMLFGLANDLVWPAIAMVLCISAGMAVAMSVIGIAALWGRQWAEGRAGSAGQMVRFDLGTRLAGACCVLAIGITLLTVTATSPQLAMNPQTAMAAGAASLSDHGG